MRVGIASVASSVAAVSVKQAQTHLVKLFDEIKSDNKRSASIQAIALAESDRGRAIAEARANGCQFVLFAKIQEGQPKIGLFGQAAKAIQIIYEVERVESGAAYAMGCAQARLSGSSQSAVENAEKRLVQSVAMDLTGKGSAPLAAPQTSASTIAAQTGEGPVAQETAKAPPDPAQAQPGEEAQALANLAGVDPAMMNAPVSPSPSRPPEALSTTAPEFCAWMAGDVPHAQSLAGACEFALAIPHRMPNFICEETTLRFRGDTHYLADTITASLRYEDGKESFSDVKMNDRKVPPAAVNQLSGLWSTGEFGGNLRSIFDATNKPAFTFLGEKKMGTRSAWAFSYKIAEQRNPRWWLSSDDQKLAPAYSGELWLDEKTGELVMFRLTADGIPKKFPTQGAETLTAYNDISFGDGTNFVLPVQSVVKTKYHGVLTTNVLQFRNCHKFQAKSRMLLDVPPATKRP